MSDIRYGRSILFFLLISINITLFGCSGGIEGTSYGSDTKLKGTAAIGAAIPFSTIIVKGADGKKLETTSDANGNFTIEVSNLKPPYLLWVDFRNLYSVAFKTGVVNIHPLTDLITKNWFAIKGYSLQTEFNKDKAAAILPTKKEISDIESKINNIISLAEFRINNDFQLFNDPFITNEMGFDGFLDIIEIYIFNNKINISIWSPDTNLKNKIINNVDLNFDFTNSNISPPCVGSPPNTCIPFTPTNPTGLRVIPSDINEFVLAWKESTDNSGIKGYYIYRNNKLVGSSPYTTYIDDDITLLNNTEYCYSIAAIDGDDNLSGKSLQQCSTTTITPNLSTPAPILNLTATALGSQATELKWDPSPESNVLGYTVYVSDFISSDFIPVETTLDTTYLLSNFLFVGPGSNDICYFVEAYVFTKIPLLMRTISSNVCTKKIPDKMPPVTTASPATSTFTSPQSIYLNCKDKVYDSGCLLTYYTLDNTPVDDFSEIYTGVINITTTTTIRFLSIDIAGNREVEKSKTYTIN